MKRTRLPPLPALALALCLPFALGACATRGEVAEQRWSHQLTLAELRGKAEDTRDRNARIQTRVAELSTRLEATETASRSAVRAAEAALREAARAMPEPELVTPALLRDDSVRFPRGSAELTPRARDLLDLFAAEYQARNQDLYVEIRGHADATGTERANRDLARRRAEAVRRHLHERYGLPLHRMGVISYGSDLPLAENTGADGRRQNRRVTLVVRP